MKTKSARGRRAKLPAGFSALVREMPPQAILDEGQYENTLVLIDELMSSGRLTPGQSLYLETLVQLVQAYEAAEHAIGSADLHPLEVLKHLLAENGLNASDLAALLGVHPSLGSKILKGDRALTVDHIRKLAKRFRVGAEVFIE